MRTKPAAAVHASCAEAAAPGDPATKALRALQAGVVIALTGAALLLDPRAEAAFDAPKRACAIAGALIGALALVCDKPGTGWARYSRTAKYAAVCAALAAVWLLVATIASPHAQLAWTSLRRALFYALFIPIGASPVLAASSGRSLLGVFGLGCTVNVLVSLAQAVGWTLPLDVAQLGGRFATGALLGNEGYVALAGALLAAACVAIAGGEMRLKLRIAAAGVAAIALLVIAINHQITSLVAFVAALVAIAAMRWRKRWLAIGLLGAVAISAGTALIAPLRDHTWAALPVGGVEGYQHLTTYRLGAWVAALDMVATRPLTGYGPGSFAAEQQTHRLAAELSLQQRFVQPTGSSFIYAHDDYLQLAAEGGIPALLLVLGAAGAILAGLARVPRPAADIERLILLALLTCGAVAALTWFPLQIPFTAIALLLASGRAWRIVADEGGP